MIATTEHQKESLRRRVALPSSELGIDIEVLAQEDLIILKLIAGRIIDRVDAAALLRAGRKSLDTEYLTSWCDRLDLRSELAEIWDEAFPGERPPGA